MKRISKILATLFAALYFTFTFAGSASADPITTAIIGALGSVGTIGWVAATVELAVMTVASIALNALAMALMSKPKAPGIATEVTTTGADTPQSFILGYYATAGNAAAAPYDWGWSGEGENFWLTYIIDIADMPINGIEKVYVNGDEYNVLPQLNPGDAGYHNDDTLGRRLDGDMSDGQTRIRWRLGNQTAADSLLVDLFNTHPERPWTNDHKLIGVSYAMVTFGADTEVFSGLPSVKFEVKGISLYDPRKDSTVGGSGAHRWNNKNTWEFSENPAVMIYNIYRGIELADGSIWGYQVPADSLPLDSWFAAMNACDEPGTQPESTDWRADQKRYTAGYEIKVNEEPADVVVELLKACGGKVVEYAGMFNISVGAPAGYVASFDDGSIIATENTSFNMGKGILEMFNGVEADYPSTKMNWEVEKAKPYYNATWEAEDGDRRNVAQISLPAVSNPRQVRRLMREYGKDNRRNRVHTIVLGAWALGIKPLDIIRWTSAKNGYDNKLFEVLSKTIDPTTLNSVLNIRERNPADYDYDDVFDADEPVRPSKKPSQSVWNGIPGLAVSASFVQADSGAMRPAIVIEWNGEYASYDSIEYEIRNAATEAEVTAGNIKNVKRGIRKITSGILPNTAYEVRAKQFTKGRKSTFSPWIAVTTGNYKIDKIDLADVLADEVDALRADADAAANSAAAAMVVANTVTNNHNALVAGFLGGTLANAFAQTSNSISVVNSSLNTITSKLENMILSTALPKDFTQDGEFWSHNISGAPSTKADLSTSTVTFVTDSAMGRVARHTAPFTGNRHIGPKEYLGNVSGQRFRATITARHNGAFAGGSASALRFLARKFNSSYIASGGDLASNTFTFTAADTVQKFTVEWTHDGATPFVLPFVYVNGTSNFGTAGPSIDISSFTVVDITAANEVAANLSTNYYTKANTDTAIALVQSNLSSQIGNVSSTLSTNYWTIANTNAAMSAMQANLTSQIGNVSSTVTTQGVAISDLQGNASSSYVMRVGAGGANAGFEMVALSNTSGAASTIRMNADNILMAGTVAMDKLVVTDLSGNLVPNGSFIYGDMRGWDNIADTVTLVDATSDGSTAVTNSPTKNMLRFNYSADWKSARCIYDTSVTAGEKFAVKFDMATGGTTRDATMRITFYFYDKTGGQISIATLTENNYGGTAWKQVSRGYTPTDAYGPVTAPAGTEFMRVTMGRLGGGAGAAYVTNLEIIKKRAGSTLITPSGITSDLIDANNFNVAGLSVFGGTLQSNNFDNAAGTGWRITQGGTINIPNALITSAKIANAAVGTLKIGDDAVSTTYSATAAISTDTGGVSVTLNPDYAAKVTVWACATDLQGITWTSQVRIKRNGTLVATSPYGGFDGSEAISITAVYAQTLAAGTTYTFRAEPGGGARSGTDVSIIAIMTYK